MSPQDRLLHEMFLAFLEFARHKDYCAKHRHLQHGAELACTCKLDDQSAHFRREVMEQITTEDLKP